jgi:hypothetical protein
MWAIRRKIQFHGVGINRTASPRAMLLYAGDNLSSPRRIGRRAGLARNCANGRRRRRKRLLITSKIAGKNVVVRLMVHQG